MNVGVSGSSGFIGWHLRARLLREKDLSLIPLGRAEFKSPEKMQAVLLSCDAVVHLAGGRFSQDDEEDYAANMALTNALFEGLDAAKRAVPVLFASSRSATEKQNGYGRSKRDGGLYAAAWGKKSGAPVSVLVMPNVIGEFAQPEHHTAVATFCRNIAAGKESTVNRDGGVELIHAEDAANAILAFLRNPVPGETRLAGMPFTVGEVYDVLTGFHDSYLSGIFPAFRTPMHKRLFNMLYSYSFEDLVPRTITPHKDERGSLVESVRTLSPGQSFVSTTVPGAVRGNHFHTRKIERFSVVLGEAVIRLRKLFDDRVLEYRVSGEQSSYIDMPTFYTHSIENTGTGVLVTSFWTDELYDEQDPDTYPEQVIAES